jgi:pimeloyl-ACP methyl ester carboxylesterase
MGGEVVRHWNADVNGISLHVAEQGPADGPPVLLIHGFPELWLSWRHQMAALAARGFRALAPDLRGYGDSTVPDDPAAYTVFHIVGDLVALLDHLALPKVMVVGHDLGAQVAWHLCLFRPDMLLAVVNLGVPFFPRGPSSLSEAFAGRDGLYIMQFQVCNLLNLTTYMNERLYCKIEDVKWTAYGMERKKCLRCFNLMKEMHHLDLV